MNDRNRTMKPAATGSLLIVALALGGMVHRVVRPGSDGSTEVMPAVPGRMIRVSSPPLHSGRMAVTASTVGMRSPEDVGEWLRTLPREERADALGTACQRMSDRDPAAAASLLAMFPDMVDAGTASNVLREWSWRDPSAAALWIQEGPLPGAITESCLPAVVEAWRGMDRAAAHDFIAALPKDEMQGRLLLEASRVLTDGDRDSARGFAGGLPEPAQRAGAFRKILEVEFRGPDDKPRALQWIACMSDAAMRKEMEAAVQKRWAEPPAGELNPPPASGGNSDPFAE